LTQNKFAVEYEDHFRWDDLLRVNPGYRRDLQSDEYGRMFLVNKKQNRLQKIPGNFRLPGNSVNSSSQELSFRMLLAALPSTGWKAIHSRIRRLY
jgi:hypothetical protein